MSKSEEEGWIVINPNKTVYGLYWKKMGALVREALELDGKTFYKVPVSVVSAVAREVQERQRLEGELRKLKENRKK